MLILAVLWVVGCGSSKVFDLKPKSYTTQARIPVHEDVKGKRRIGEVPKGVPIVVTGVVRKPCSRLEQTRFRVNTDQLGNGLFACFSIDDVTP